MNSHSILFIDDDKNLARASADLLRLELGGPGMRVLIIASLPMLETYLSEQHTELPILAIVDLWLQPDPEGGFKAIAMLRKSFPHIYIVVLSAFLDEPAKTRLSTITNLAIVEKPVTFNFLTGFIKARIADILPS
jgi:DNA-binding response OmpR family regulator